MPEVISNLSKIEAELAKLTASELADSIMHELADETTWLAENQADEGESAPLTLEQVVDREIDSVSDSLSEHADYTTMIGHAALAVVLLSHDYMETTSNMMPEIRRLTAERVTRLRAGLR